MSCTVPASRQGVQAFCDRRVRKYNRGEASRELSVWTAASPAASTSRKAGAFNPAGRFDTPADEDRKTSTGRLYSFKSTLPWTTTHLRLGRYSSGTAPSAPRGATPSGLPLSLRGSAASAVPCARSAASAAACADRCACDAAAPAESALAWACRALASASSAACRACLAAASAVSPVRWAATALPSATSAALPASAAFNSAIAAAVALATVRRSSSAIFALTLSNADRS